MENLSILFYIFGAFIVWIMLAFIVEIVGNSNKYIRLKPKLDNLDSSIEQHRKRVEEDEGDFQIKVDEWNSEVIKEKNEIDKIAKQKSMGFPWLAEAYADYFALIDDKIENHLRYKKRPAKGAANNVKLIKQEKRELLKENKIIKYKINYYEKLFPWLSDLIAEDEDEEIPVRISNEDIIESHSDNVSKYLTDEEYKSLPSVKRNQIALDRYLKNRNKSKWSIGRDYEMYVGHLYQKKGYIVEYKGIIDGFDDLGRDVIAKKDNEVCIIQCKRWAQYKDIHEKHIFQLFGTTMEYWIKNFKKHNTERNFEAFAKFLNEEKIRPIFFTSTNLSERAKDMANALSVEVIEGEPLGEFPRIKCNINNSQSGVRTKIYHLPMDQQYDRTIIGDHKGEFYAYTVKEAEDAGFRRAFRHRKQL